MIGYTLTCLTLQYVLHSLDVAVVRDETSVLSERQKSQLTSADFVHQPSRTLPYDRCWQMHQFYTVKGRTTAVIQTADAGVSVVFWTMSAVFIARGGQSSKFQLELLLLLANMESRVRHQIYRLIRY